MYSEQQIMMWASGFFWPLLRISAMFVAIPVFSGRFVDSKILVGASLMITFFTLPLLPDHRAIEVFSHEGVITGLQQILIGLSMGFVLQLVFSAIIFAGQGIAYSMGLGFASMVDPTTGVSVPVVSQFYLVLSTLLYLTLGGHLVLIEMLIDSFNTLPIGATGMERSDIWSIIAWSSRIFSAGLLMAMPAIASLLMVNVAFGVVTRAAPQLNIFAVGFPAMVLAGILLLSTTMPTIGFRIQWLWRQSFETLSQLMAVI